MSIESEKIKKDRCPCGGIILIDTEDFEIPLCDECYEIKKNTGDNKK